MSTHHKSSSFSVRKTLLPAILSLFLLWGCSTAPRPMPTITKGDKVLLDYTCRIEDGSMLATTRKADLYAENANPSHAFLPLEHYSPAIVDIGTAIQQWDKPTIRPLSGEIAVRISKQIEGMAYGVNHTLTVSSEAIPDLPNMERYIQYARTMRRPKQRTIPKAQFIANTGKEPEVGEILFADQPIQWKVAGITGDKVDLHYLAEDGKVVKLPYGEAVIRDRGDHFDLEIDVRIDGLVRVGPYIGRIIDMTDELFLVDFVHPFGRRELSCKVMVNTVNERANRVLDSASVSNE